MISIHAPMWGATSGQEEIYVGNDYFNPRTHVGCDYSPISLIVHLLVFQSTHPCGVRQCDTLVHLPSNHISIHAPMWGAT